MQELAERQSFVRCAHDIHSTVELDRTRSLLRPPRRGRRRLEQTAVAGHATGRRMPCRELRERSRRSQPGTLAWVRAYPPTAVPFFDEIGAACLRPQILSVRSTPVTQA
jgi:hypothetical protein